MSGRPMPGSIHRDEAGPDTDARLDEIADVCTSDDPGAAAVSTVGTSSDAKIHGGLTAAGADCRPSRVPEPATSLEVEASPIAGSWTGSAVIRSFR